jgi:hypothetical protein
MLPCALQNAEQALRPGRPRWLVGCTSRPLVRAGQAACRVRRAKRFGAVAGPQQAEHTLCAWVELNFGPEAI